MPDVFGHGSTVKWSERQDFHLRPPGPKPGALKTELRSDKKMALPVRLALTVFPQTTGCFSIQLREQMVGSAGNAPVVASGLFEDTGFTGRQPDHFPEKSGWPAIHSLESPR